MIAIDANLLIFAYNASAPQHPAVKRWLEQVLSAPEPVRLGWSTASYSNFGLNVHV